MSAKYKLVYLKNNEEFLLDSPTMLIGRSDSCPIKIDVSNMSREHARIRAIGDDITVEDLHSTNGTFVNNKRIEGATPLTPGSTVRFGEESFSLQAVDSEVTIVGVPTQGKSKTADSLVVEDEDEEDSTMLFHAYQLPPGWDKVEDDAGFDSQDSAAKKKAIEAYVKKASAGFKGARGLILFFFVEEEPPSIRMVSLKDDQDREWSFGRTEDNDVVYRHQSVSEHHASLKYQSGRWLLEDKASTNGIWTNKSRHKSIELDDGLHFHVGTVEVLARLVNH